MKKDHTLELQTQQKKLNEARRARLTHHNSSPTQIQLILRTLDGSTFDIRIHRPGSTVQTVLQQLEDMHGINQEHTTLIYNGTKLKKDASVERIVDDTVLHLLEK